MSLYGGSLFLHDIIGDMPRRSTRKLSRGRGRSTGKSVKAPSYRQTTRALKMGGSRSRGPRRVSR